MGRVGREPKLACERRGANGLAVANLLALEVRINAA
jgi:hypothetical protein